MIYPTPDEIKNGWTPESLTMYMRQREGAQNVIVLGPRKKSLVIQNSYDPFKW